MAETKALLEHRKKVKGAKPRFVVKESKFAARVKSRWRYPRGKHSKVRQQHRGRVALPNPGFGSPKAVRGLDKSGLEPVLVRSLTDVAGVNKEAQGVIVSGLLGGRKRVALLKAIQEAGLVVLNVKDVTAVISGIEAGVAERKKKRAAKKSAKKEKDEKKKKKAAEKEAKDAKKDEKKSEDASVEDAVKKEEAQRKEAEKVMTKKQ